MSENNSAQPSTINLKPPCPACETPLDLQMREPWLWRCAGCRTWFNKELDKVE